MTMTSDPDYAELAIAHGVAEKIGVDVKELILAPEPSPPAIQGFLIAERIVSSRAIVAAITRRFLDSIQDDPIAKTDTAIGPLEGAFNREAKPLLSHAWRNDWPPSVARGPTEYHSLPVEEDGMLRQDARLAAFLSRFGESGKASADKIRSKAQKRWEDHGHTEHHSLWVLWLDRKSIASIEDATYPKWAQALLKVLWLDRVRPELEREQVKKNHPVRMPTEIADTFALARCFGGSPVGKKILVEPPKGITLILPFDDDMRVARDGSVVPLRAVLTPASLRTYLATIVLFQDSGIRDDGSFEVENAPNAILGVVGATKYRCGPKGAYQGYSAKEVASVRDHLDLFRSIRVRAVGDLEAEAGDALLDIIRERSTGRIVTYAHSRLVVGAMRSAYIRIPRAVCTLEPRYIPYGIGVALMIRRGIVAFARKKKPIEDSIETWLKLAGIDGSEGARKHGVRYWEDAVNDITTVATQAHLGNIEVCGTGKNTTLRIVVNDSLQASYQELVDASKAHERAKRTARILDKRAKPR